MNLLFTALLLLAPAAAQTAFPERIRKVIETNAALPNGSYQTIAAKLYLHRDPQWCSRRL
jgi:hypothetical protein